MAVPGDFIEFGVLHGATLFPLASIAKKQGKRCHAVDSFTGFLPPTELDGPLGEGLYSTARLERDLKGPGRVRKGLKDRELESDVDVWEGHVPGILGSLPDGPFSLAHLDMDTWEPTYAALQWLWSRMSPGGIIAVHDWWPEQDVLAAGAFNKFLVEVGRVRSGVNEITAWVVK